MHKCDLYGISLFLRLSFKSKEWRFQNSVVGTKGGMGKALEILKHDHQVILMKKTRTVKGIKCGSRERCLDESLLYKQHIREEQRGMNIRKPWGMSIVSSSTINTPHRDIIQLHKVYLQW